MSQHEPFGAPYGQVQQAPPPPPPPGYGYPPPAPQKTNTMAILGLVFAFVASPLGIVFSAIGLKQTKERNEGGRGLALAGLILSIVFTLLLVVWLVLAAVVFTSAVRTAGALDAAASSASEALASESAALDSAIPDTESDSASGDTGSADSAGVAAACHVIVPAILQAESDLTSAASVEEYQAGIGSLNATMLDAASQASDPQFAADVQQLADDFSAVSDAVGQGEDPSSLEGTITADAETVGADCAAVGVTQ